MTIWKFGIPVMENVVTVHMPRAAHILTVQMQHGEPKLWALVDPNAPMEPRYFRWFGTGYALPDALGQYVGTVQSLHGSLVFHLFAQDGT